MTVAQLIDALSKYPSDWEVLVDGHDITPEHIGEYDHAARGTHKYIKSEKVVTIG